MALLERNRRIGDRFDVDVADVEWIPAGCRRRFRRRPETARLADLSVTGAALIAAPGVGVNDLVHISVNGHGGVVKDRRVVTSADTSLVRYGVQFIALDAGLQDLVAQTISAHRPDLLWRWTFVD